MAVKVKKSLWLALYRHKYAVSLDPVYAANREEAEQEARKSGEERGLDFVRVDLYPHGFNLMTRSLPGEIEVEIEEEPREFP